MNLRRLLGYAVALMFLALTVSSCKDDNSGDGDGDGGDVDPIIAAFTFVVEDYDVTFTNGTLNAATYSWDFGDTESSTDKDPVHTYAEAGEYTVKMTASNDNEEKVVEKKVIIAEVGQDAMTLLTGGSSKTWVLATMEGALSFGNPGAKWYNGTEEQPVETWWMNSEEHALPGGRECLFDNEYTFTSAGAYTRETNGALWTEWKVFDIAGGEGCSADGEELLSRLNGDDVSAWRDGDFTFEIETWAGADTMFTQTLTTSGMGAYIGHYVSGTNTSDYAVHDGAEYGIVSISKDTVELISYGWGGDDMDPKESDPDYVHDPTKGSRWYKVIMVPKAD